MQIRYPSKDFTSSIQKAIDDGLEFEIYAQNRLFRSAIKKYLDALFYRTGRRVNPLVAIFHIDLVSGISNVFNSQKYRVEYSDQKDGLLIDFRSVDR